MVLPAGNYHIGSVSVDAAETFSHGGTTISGTALIVPANPARLSVAIYNNGAATVWVGGSSVSASNGMPILAETERLVLSKAAIYGVPATGSVDLRWVEEV